MNRLKKIALLVFLVVSGALFGQTYPLDGLPSDGLQLGNDILTVPVIGSLQTQDALEANLQLILHTGETHDWNTNTDWQLSLGVKVEAYNVKYELLETYQGTFELSSSSPRQLVNFDFAHYESEVTYFKIFKTSYQSPNFNSADLALFESTAALEVEVVKDINYSVEGVSIESQQVEACMSCQTTVSAVDFTWSLSNGYFVKDYDLQIYKLEVGSDGSAIVDWSQASTIEVQVKEGEQPIYKMTLSEGTGYYFWRVRPVGNFYEGGRSDQRNYGVWSIGTLPNQGGSLYTKAGSSDYSYQAVVQNELLASSAAITGHYFYYNQFDENYNWSHGKVLSEGSKQSETMTYANGLNQVKQTQVHSYSNKQVLGGQTVYDYSGRPALQALPAPVNDDKLGYKPEFFTNQNNKEYSAADFDTDSKIYNNTALQSNQEGQANYYYSDANGATTEHPENQFVADAKGKPYSRTLFYSDATGRVLKQGGVGEEMQLKPEHSDFEETHRNVETFYSAVSQNELDQLFGSEAPIDSTVYKVLTIDPNKVTSVTYISYTGQVLATAMSEGTNHQNLLSAGVGQLGSEFHLKGQNFPQGQHAMSESRSVVNEADSPLTVQLAYNLTPQSFGYSCENPMDICENCDYKVSISIRNILAVNQFGENIEMTFDVNPEDLASCYSGESLTLGTGSWYSNLSYWEPTKTTSDISLNKPSLWANQTSAMTSVNLPKGSYLITRSIYVNNKTTDADQIELDYLQKYKNELNQAASTWDAQTNCCGPIEVQVDGWDCNELPPFCLNDQDFNPADNTGLTGEEVFISEIEKVLELELVADYKNKLFFNGDRLLQHNYKSGGVYDLQPLLTTLTAETGAGCRQLADCFLGAEAQLTRNRLLAEAGSTSAPEEVAQQPNQSDGISFDKDRDVLGSYFRCLGYNKGLTGDYYSGNSDLFDKDIDEYIGTLVDPFVAVDTRTGTSEGLPFTGDEFKVKWQGQLDIQNAGNYVFKITVDDGARLYVDGVVVIDEWEAQSATAYSSAAISLSAGLHQIRLEYFEHTGNSVVELAYTGTDTQNADRLISMDNTYQECLGYTAVGYYWGDFSVLEKDPTTFYVELPSPVEIASITVTDVNHPYLERIKALEPNRSCLVSYFSDDITGIPSMTNFINTDKDDPMPLVSVSDLFNDITMEEAAYAVCMCVGDLAVSRAKVNSGETGGNEVQEKSIDLCMSACDNNKPAFEQAIDDWVRTYNQSQNKSIEAGATENHFSATSGDDDWETFEMLTNGQDKLCLVESMYGQCVSQCEAKILVNPEFYADQLVNLDPTTDQDQRSIIYDQIQVEQEGIKQAITQTASFAPVSGSVNNLTYEKGQPFSEIKHELIDFIYKSWEKGLTMRLDHSNNDYPVYDNLSGYTLPSGYVQTQESKIFSIDVTTPTFDALLGENVEIKEGYRNLLLVVNTIWDKGDSAYFKYDDQVYEVNFALYCGNSSLTPSLMSEALASFSLKLYDQGSVGELVLPDLNKPIFDTKNELVHLGFDEQDRLTVELSEGIYKLATQGDFNTLEAPVFHAEQVHSSQFSAPVVITLPTVINQGDEFFFELEAMIDGKLQTKDIMLQPVYMTSNKGNLLRELAFEVNRLGEIQAVVDESSQTIVLFHTISNATEIVNWEVKAIVDQQLQPNYSPSSFLSLNYTQEDYPVFYHDLSGCGIQTGGDLQCPMGYFPVNYGNDFNAFNLVRYKRLLKEKIENQYFPFVYREVKKALKLDPQISEPDDVYHIVDSIKFLVEGINHIGQVRIEYNTEGNISSLELLIRSDFGNDNSGACDGEIRVELTNGNGSSIWPEFDDPQLDTLIYSTNFKVKDHLFDLSFGTGAGTIVLENYDEDGYTEVPLTAEFVSGTYVETANPLPNAVNSSAVVCEYTRVQGYRDQDWYDGLPDAGFDDTEENKDFIVFTGPERPYANGTFKLDVIDPVGGTDFVLVLQKGVFSEVDNWPAGRYQALKATTSSAKAGQWQTLEFKLWFPHGGTAGMPNPSSIDEIVLHIDYTNAQIANHTGNVGETYHLDNFRFEAQESNGINTSALVYTSHTQDAINAFSQSIDAAYFTLNTQVEQNYNANIDFTEGLLGVNDVEEELICNNSFDYNDNHCLGGEVGTDLSCEVYQCNNNWDAVYGTIPQREESYNSALKGGISGSAELIYNSVEGSGSVLSQAVTIREGNDYSLSFAFKNSGSIPVDNLYAVLVKSGSFTYETLETDARNTLLTEGETDVSNIATGNWNEIEINFTATDDYDQVMFFIKNQETLAPPLAFDPCFSTVAWEFNKSYQPGERITIGGNLYEATMATAAGYNPYITTTEYWSLVSTSCFFDDTQCNNEAVYPTFNLTTAYTEGTVVSHMGRLYFANRSVAGFDPINHHTGAAPIWIDLGLCGTGVVGGGVSTLLLDDVSLKEKRYQLQCAPVQNCIACMKWNNTEEVLEKLNEGDLGTPQKIEILTCEGRKEVYKNVLVQDQLDACLASKINALETAYQTNCLDKVDDEFVISYDLGYHHFTLYYYDRAGNLIRTVSPEGVALTKDSDLPQVKAFREGATETPITPKHRLETKYFYNSIKQLVRQETPDGGITSFWYNGHGQLVLSQDAVQKEANPIRYSYTTYDALGRISEVGEMSGYDCEDCLETKIDFPFGFPNAENVTKSEVTKTVYTDEASCIDYQGKKQENLRNRISYVHRQANGYDMYTYYSYDPHGNVKWLIQEVPGLGKKTIAYEYDLVSGNVNRVVFQENTAEQFIHKYEYDQDNRIVEVYTSRDNLLWTKEAGYSYYLHGPLARVEIGQDKIQGTDYIYTIEGYLKAVNQPELNGINDPGKDGLATNNFLQDEYAMELGYYQGDYQRTGVGVGENAAYNPNTADYKNLYNGNIAYWVSNTRAGQSGSNNTNSSNVTYGTAVNFYRYDVLNRLKTVQFKKYENMLWVDQGSDYSEAFNYDRNGNITQATRYGDRGKMDELNYGYAKKADENGDLQIKDNRLYHYTENQIDDDLYENDLGVIDLSAFSQATTFNSEDADINTNYNYQYDEKGNLITDHQEKMRIYWNVIGKVEKIEKYDDVQLTNVVEEIRFEYDAMGNRVLKEVDSNGDDTMDRTTYYVRDASGNVMAIYETNYDTDLQQTVFKLKEVPIYGSDRLGQYRPTDQILGVVHGCADIAYSGTDNLASTQATTSKWVVSSEEGLSLLDFEQNGVSLSSFVPNSEPSHQKMVSYLDAENNLVLAAGRTDVYPIVWELFNACGEKINVPSGMLTPGYTTPNNGGVILKKPNSENRYYFFYVSAAAQTQGSLNYIEIDMTSSAGEVVSTSVQQVTGGLSYGGSILPIEYSNGNSRLLLNNYNPATKEVTIYSVDITSGGIEQQAIAVFEWNGTGDLSPNAEMVMSHSGEQIALSLVPELSQATNVPEVAIWDFSVKYNTLDNLQLIQLDKNKEDAVFGTHVVKYIEFSPSDDYLYYGFISSEFGNVWGKVGRYDLSSGRIDFIRTIEDDLYSDNQLKFTIEAGSTTGSYDLSAVNPDQTGENETVAAFKYNRQTFANSDTDYKDFIALNLDQAITDITDRVFTMDVYDPNPATEYVIVMQNKAKRQAYVVAKANGETVTEDYKYGSFRTYSDPSKAGWQRLIFEAPLFSERQIGVDEIDQIILHVDPKNTKSGATYYYDNIAIEAAGNFPYLDIATSVDDKLYFIDGNKGLYKVNEPDNPAWVDVNSSTAISLSLPVGQRLVKEFPTHLFRSSENFIKCSDPIRKTTMNHWIASTQAANGNAESTLSFNEDGTVIVDSRVVEDALSTGKNIASIEDMDGNEQLRFYVADIGGVDCGNVDVPNYILSGSDLDLGLEMQIYSDVTDADVAWTAGDYETIDTDGVNEVWPVAPAPGINPDKYRVRWRGYIYIAEEADYTFYMNSGMMERIKFDAPSSSFTAEQFSPNSNWWWPSEPQEHVVVKHLTKGYHHVRYEYFYNKNGGYSWSVGESHVSLSWSSPTIAKELIPADKLFNGTLPPGRPSTLKATVADRNIGLMTEIYAGNAIVDYPTNARIDYQVNNVWHWGEDQNYPTGPSAAVWSGYVYIEPGDYNFAINVADKQYGEDNYTLSLAREGDTETLIELPNTDWVQGTKFNSSTGTQTVPYSTSSTITYNTAGWYKIRLEYQAQSWPYLCQLSWNKGSDFELIPAQNFRPSAQTPCAKKVVPKGLTAFYYDAYHNAGLDITTQVPTVTTVVEDIDFDWVLSSPNPGLISGDWSVKYEGYIYLDKKGRYEFESNSRNSQGASKISIDGVSLSTKTYFLYEGYHKIEVLYGFNEVGDARLNLSWKQPNETSFTTVPNEVLYTESPQQSFMYGQGGTNLVGNAQYIKSDMNVSSTFAKALGNSNKDYFLVTGGDGKLSYHKVNTANNNSVHTGTWELLDKNNQVVTYDPAINDVSFAVHNDYTNPLGNKLFVGVNTGTSINLHEYNILENSLQYSRTLGTYMYTECGGDCIDNGVANSYKRMRLGEMHLSPLGTELTVAISTATTLNQSGDTPISHRLVKYVIDRKDDGEVVLTKGPDKTISTEIQDYALYTGQKREYKTQLMSFDYSADGQRIYYLTQNCSDNARNCVYREGCANPNCAWVTLSSVDTETGQVDWLKQFDYPSYQMNIRRANNGFMYVSYEDNGAAKIGLFEDKGRAIDEGINFSEVDISGISHTLNFATQPQLILSDPCQTPVNNLWASRGVGNRVYELKDHLGNVRVVLSDKRLRQVNKVVQDFEDYHHQSDVQSYSGTYSGTGAGTVTMYDLEVGDELIMSAMLYITDATIDATKIYISAHQECGRCNPYYSQYFSLQEYLTANNLTLSAIVNTWVKIEMPYTFSVAGNRVLLQVDNYTGTTIYEDDLTIEKTDANSLLVADVVSWNDYYAFGAIKTGRSYSAGDYRYGFNGMEKDGELKGEGNSYDFGARIYDSRLGRWLSLDPLAKKFPSYTPYSFVNNMPIVAIDPDGRDIVILSQPDGAGGLGHAAVLIGNDDDGWFLYSDNGTTGSSGSKGPSDVHPEIGVPYETLDEFAKKGNIKEDGTTQYKAAFKITTDKETDELMKKAAAKSVREEYDLLNNSCIDVCSDALEAGGLPNGGGTVTDDNIYNGTGKTTYVKTPIPNLRYEIIKRQNKNNGSDVSDIVNPPEKKDVVEESFDINKINQPQPLDRPGQYPSYNYQNQSEDLNLSF